jgi:hypothetical protein
MILDEAMPLLTKILDQLSEAERALDQLRQSGWPGGAAGRDERGNAAVEFARSAAQTVAAKAVEVARVALLLVTQLEGGDGAIRPRPQKPRRPRKQSR